jgi:hypothetical protein
MADQLFGTGLTDAWMANPWMFDPTQKSNRFSLFNDQRIPFPPTYDDTAGGPTDAMGRPIQSYQTWKQQNPGGVTINATPAQPPPAPMSSPQMDQLAGWQALTNPEMAARGNTYGDPYLNMIAPGGNPMTNGILQGAYSGKFGLAPQSQGQAQGGAAQAAAQGGGGMGGSPNNWQAALSALSNPGNPVTQGANVPLAQGYQPAGGVNQAFLNQAGGGAGMNQNFLSALAAIQGRRAT